MFFVAILIYETDSIGTLMCESTLRLFLGFDKHLPNTD